MTDKSLPLCVDLDETLVLKDTFYTAIGALFRQKPRLIPQFLWQFLQGGRPRAKAWLAQIFPADPARLQYRKDLLDYLRAERAKGRKLYLISAANQRDVLRIADHLQLFDAAYGSSEKTNLKGATKAAFILDTIGAPFAYAGDSFADLAVWKKAEAAILCGKAVILRKVLNREVEAVFPRRSPGDGAGAARPAPRAR